MESTKLLRQDPIELARRNWVESGWDESADGMALVTSIMRVQQVFLARIETLLRPHGLTFARYEVLRLLAFTRQGVLPVGKIGERLQVHPASVTNAVQRLEEAALVDRRTNPDDRRGVFADMPLSSKRIGDVVAGLQELRRRFGDFT
jgi:DNA-binding MarR family transcriptional regulator